MTIESKRWQKLAGLLKEQTFERQRQRFQKEKEEMEAGEDPHPYATFRPGRDEPDKRDFLPNTYDWNLDLDEQIKPDVSPESMAPSREDEEEWLARRTEEDYTFSERLPPGHEDWGFNAVVINDIGEELLNIEADMRSLRKAEILYKRLGRAIEALKTEIRDSGKVDEAMGSNDSVDGPYTEKAEKQPMEECGQTETDDVVIEWD